MLDINKFRRNWFNYVDGQWTRNSKRELISVEDPATGQEIGQIQSADEEDLEAAVTSARKCYQKGDLQKVSLPDRAKMMFKVADYLESCSDEIALCECLDNGKNIKAAQGQAFSAARYYRYYAGMVDKLEGKSIPLGSDYIDYTNYEPYGVSAQIVPWNFPLDLAARGASAALATGNCVIIKSPELSPTSVTFLAEAYEPAGVPRRAIQILCGYGSTTCAQLVSHPGVNHIVFTGSVPTGKKILKSAAENIVPAVMELGGKSAAIIYPDADLDYSVSNVLMANTANAGQICSACSRVLIHESVYDQVLEKLKDQISRLSIGPGIKDNEVTPVISEEQLNKILGLIQEGKGELICGGKRFEGYPDGYFVEPTLFAGLDPQEKLAQHEIFGPVLTAFNFSTPEEAVEIANATEYGLVAGVYTRDLNLALWSSKQLLAGQVFVNEWFAGGVETPFGGFKKSGFGREKGVEALYGYVQTKNTAIRLGK